jgi:transposase-like protein
MAGTSRVNREVYARFCGRLEVKFLRPTRRSYLYRAVDRRGLTIDFRLSAKRDAEAAKRFFRKALGKHPPSAANDFLPGWAAHQAACSAGVKRGAQFQGRSWSRREAG